jgi:two-component system, OmpR family, phosphate regulon sensor histidine kinase PhoR
MRISATRQLSVFIALILTILVILVIGFISLIKPFWLMMVVSVAFFFGVSWLLISFILNKFISDKIKPVIKTIQEFPLSHKKLNQRSRNTSLTEVKKEVDNWEKSQIKEVERLKELEKYRKDFVGNVSHELKTPIFNIQGYILTLLEGGIDDPKINKLYLRRAEKSVDRMISIVEDLESINKLESGELKLKFEKFDIVKLVEEVFDLEHRIADEMEVSLEFNPKPDKPLWVMADRKGMLEVMTNLVSNGIKYNKKTGFVKVAFYDLEDHLLVEVTDNGIGVDKKHLPRIFERFYRVDKSRSREQGGTGLGLSIVKHIIEAHDQSINVKSTLDEGTSFAFTLDKAKDLK